jgi:hypothetical protein
MSLNSTNFRAKNVQKITSKQSRVMDSVESRLTCNNHIPWLCSLSLPFLSFCSSTYEWLKCLCVSCELTENVQRTRSQNKFNKWFMMYLLYWILAHEIHKSLFQWLQKNHNFGNDQSCLTIPEWWQSFPFFVVQLWRFERCDISRRKGRRRKRHKVA